MEQANGIHYIKWWPLSLLPLTVDVALDVVTDVVNSVENIPHVKNLVESLAIHRDPCVGLWPIVILSCFGEMMSQWCTAKGELCLHTFPRHACLKSNPDHPAIHKKWPQ